MRCLLTGASGFLGTRLAESAPDDVDLVGTWRRSRPAPGLPAHRVDLSDRAATLALVDGLAPELVLHTAYGTDDLARDVVDATTNVADAAARAGAALVHLSSDVVFSGEAAPYDEQAPPSPISAYGRAKAAAEVEARLSVPDAAVVRTSLILTPEVLEPRTRWVADALSSGRPVDLYVDEIRMPVHRDDLALGVWRLVSLVRGQRGGVWHLAGGEALSRWELGRLVCDAVGGDRGLLRAAHSPRGVDDPRPRDLRLGCDRAREQIGWAPRRVSALYTPRPDH